MAGYWIVRASAIKDEAALKRYGELWAAIALRYDAEIIAGRGQIDTREGTPYPRQLVIRFPSFEAAVNCYEDPEYEAAMAIGLQAFDRELAILEG